MNKKYIFLFIPLAAALLFLGCTANLTFNDPEVVADDLKDMGILLNDVKAALTVVEEDEVDSRTVQPADVSNKTPATLFAEGTPSGGVVSYPEDGFYHDLYGEDGNDWYFTLEAHDATYYNVKLYIYPRPNFYITYTYEEYLVDGSSTAWTAYADTTPTEGFIKLENYYTDSTTGTRTLVDTSTAYSEIPVPNDPMDAISAYTFSSLSGAPAPTAGASNYSAETSEHIKGKNTAGFTIDSKTYYTEHDSNALRTSVAYIVRDYSAKKYSDIHTVTRSQVNADAGTSKIRSLTTDNSTYTFTEAISTWVTGGIKNFSSSKEYWYTGGPSSVSGDPLYTDSMELSETAADSGIYSGTRTISYSGKDYTYKTTVGEASSRYKMKHTRTAWTNRAFGTDESVEIDLQDLGNLSIQMPGAIGIFTGYYEQEMFEGTYQFGLRTANVTVTDGGILVDDVFFSFGDL